MRQRDDLLFPMEEYERRLRELRMRMEEHGLDAVLITTPENTFYLTGYASQGYFCFHALVVPLDGEPFMVPRRLEDSGVQAYSWVEVRRPYEDTEDPPTKVGQVLKEFDLHTKHIGYEKDCWFFTAAQQERLFAACPAGTFVDCSGIVEEGRVVKSDYEIDVMREAASMAEVGMRAGIDAVAEGATEDDVAAEIQYAMTKAGSQWPGLAPFVASGERGSIGHATWMGRTIQHGDAVFLETGGCLRRYHAALMRTVVVGEPKPAFREAESVVLEAIAASIEAIRPGVTARHVDAANREIIANSTFGGEQATRSGYSIGIAVPPDWGEGHILSLRSDEERILQPNMTFHLIPWVQIPGEAGIGLTETVRVTETGCEVLTNFERKLFVK